MMLMSMSGFWRNLIAASVLPFCAMSISGVTPLLSVQFTSAPAPTSRPMTSELPVSAAKCRGMRFLWLPRFTSAPLSSRSLTRSLAFFIHT